MASQSSARRSSATPSPKLRERSRANSRLRRLPPETASPVVQQLERSLDHRHGGRIDARRDPRGERQLVQVAEQARSRSRRSSRSAPTASAASAAAALSVVITSVQRATSVGARLLALGGGRDRAAADRLGQEEDVAGGPRRSCARSRSGCATPVTDMPYLGSGSSIEWPPMTATPASAATSAPPRRISREHVAAEPLEREGDEVERGQRPRAHRVDVRERVGGRYAAEVVGIVDDRREEVDRLHERQLVADAVDARVVARSRSRPARPGPPSAEAPRRSRRDRRPDLAGAAGPVRERGQPHRRLSSPPPCHRPIIAGQWPKASQTSRCSRRSRR